MLGVQDTPAAGPHLFLADAPREGGVTLYRMTGDLFAWLSVLALAGLVGWAFRDAQGRGGAQSEPRNTPTY